MTGKKTHVFGPVPSRRLGRSLGVDLVPYKACSFDCVYCQIGRTTNHTTERREWVPLREVLDEVRSKLESRPDYITLSGSGEPTLYARMGELIAGIKAMTDIPIAVLTNGSLLPDPEVRRELLEADLVAPSLDAATEEAFGKINRPAAGVRFADVLKGLEAFRAEFTGSYWLEILLVAGVNDSDAEIDALVEAVRTIGPDRVQLNTVTRPPAESLINPVPLERLQVLAERFEPRAEIIAHFREGDGTKEAAAGEDAVYEMLKRRPCTLDDIAAGLGAHRQEVLKQLDVLVGKGLVKTVETAGRTYYKSMER